MMRKDCDSTRFRRQARPVIALLAAAVLTAPAAAQTVRLWPQAVVVGDTVLLRDVAELSGFDPATEAVLLDLVMQDAPLPGGDGLLSLQDLRPLLAAAAVNMATVRIGGAVECAISRPTTWPGDHDASTGTQDGSGDRSPRGARQATVAAATREAQPTGDQAGAGDKPATLRQAVFDWFHAELARYQGTADVTFHATAAGVLDLSGPAYSFDVRRRSGGALGVVNIEVGVLADGAVVQSVPLRVTVRLVRSVVTARRPINQDAVIRATDVERASISFSRLEGLGLGDEAAVIGQRSRKFLEPGTVIQNDDLEVVPLVTRGQIVTLESVEGGIVIVTSAKCVADGRLGETVVVRDPNQKGVEFEAVVVGPGKVRMGGRAPAVERIVMGSDRP